MLETSQPGLPISDRALAAYFSQAGDSIVEEVRVLDETAQILIYTGIKI